MALMEEHYRIREKTVVRGRKLETFSNNGGDSRTYSTLSSTQEGVARLS